MQMDSIKKTLSGIVEKNKTITRDDLLLTKQACSIRKMMEAITDQRQDIRFNYLSQNGQYSLKNHHRLSISPIRGGKAMFQFYLDIKNIARLRYWMFSNPALQTTSHNVSMQMQKANSRQKVIYGSDNPYAISWCWSVKELEWDLICCAL